MKSRFNIQQLQAVVLASLVTTVVLSQAWASTVEDGDTQTDIQSSINSDTQIDSQAEVQSLESLAGLYSDRIARLELEIRNETARRTSILDRLDAVIKDLTILEDKSHSVVENTPSLADSMKHINKEIAGLERDIGLNKNLLEQLQNTLDRQPELSLWQAALGKPAVQTRQKLLATQGYLVHTTRKNREQLQIKRSMLARRQQSLNNYKHEVSESIGKLKDHLDRKIELRKKLEHQLADISSHIVARQDRISILSDRSQQLLANPISFHFTALKKKLSDPVEGKVIRKFSEPKAKGLLQWKGILVEAPLGIPFNAVSDGLVVFADQLQGLGNVAIVDHGHGYMTLYGMAELLLVEQDQFLLAGDPVGTVGESVSADASALYFEVRHNAEALDPQDWLEMQQITQKNAL